MSGAGANVGEDAGAGAGGRLVVLDRGGREARSFPLRGAALATLGSDPACDIRVMLPSVAKHHATIAVHTAQTVIRNVEGSATLVNGAPVSVAALRHGDVITLADRHLRWEYDDPTGRRQPRGVSPSVRVLAAASGPARGRRRGSDTAVVAATALHRDRGLQLALEMNHRASMPGSSGGKQVAIVQPQRRDTSLQIDVEQTRSSPQPKRRSNGTDSPPAASATSATSGTVPAHTTQATLWIESRKTSPRRAKSLQTTSGARGGAGRGRKSTPLRMAVLKRAHRPSLVKIQAPLTIDYTKQAAIMLMTGHTKSKLSKSPTYVVKRPSPVHKTPRNSRRTLGATPLRRTPRGPGLRTSGDPPLRTSASRFSRSPAQHISVGSERRTSRNPVQRTSGSPAQGTSGSPAHRTSGSPAHRTSGSPAQRTTAGAATRTPGATGNRTTRSLGNQSVTILEITDSESNRSDLPSVSTRSSDSPRKSPALPSASPKKSALKDTTKKTSRKIESIKFDLTNLENHHESDVVLLSESTKYSDSNVSEEDITLHYSDSSVPTLSPSSPASRRSIHSRSSRIVEKLGISRQSVLKLREDDKVQLSPSRTLTPNSRTSRKSTRGSLIVQKALNESSLTDYTQSEQSRVASAFRTRTLSPRKNMESYSIVDLVSLESNDSSVYSSADSTNTGDYGTPQTSVGRRTRSTIDPTLLGSSTPYLGNKRETRSKSNLTMNISTRSSISTRRSKSLTTPENKNVSVNSTRVSRRSRSRSRINDSDLLLLDDTEVEDSSPKTSKRTRSIKSNASDVAEPTSNIENEGTSTPENRQSPVEVGTPVLSIQSLLDSSRSSLTSHTSSKRGRRKTIGVLAERRPRPAAALGSKGNTSFGCIAKKTVLRLSRGSSETSDRTDEGAPQPENEETVTPKSAVKLVPEAVKNKHSTAKKPVSKRSLIDDLDQSDIVKQLFNSPVKRKLSQSMNEFSRKQSFDEEDVVRVRRSTRNTVGDDSLSDNDAVYTPERFVSPIQTPNDTPNMSGINRLLKKNTPELCNVNGVRSVLRTPRTRRSVRNDLTNVSGVKAVFAKSPRNRLSDVRVKEVFAASPADDLRRVTGVKALFRQNESPKNDLTNVRGVKRLFAKKSPRNDLRNVSGVKKTFDRNTPKNDLTDVRGVRNMFEHQRRREETADMSGIEELFHESTPSVHDAEALCDQLVGKPVVKAVYSKTLSSKKPSKKPRVAPSLHTSIDVITNNVQEWLEGELHKRLHRGDTSSATSKVTKELQRLTTETVQGEEPILLSRTRNTSIKKSASEIYSEHSLPIKKRSLVQVSLDSSKNMLPIKKRAVVHSTPVKGRVNITMNASELGRVSPIAVFDHTRDHHIRSTRQMPIVEEKPRRRGAKPAAAVEHGTPPRRATRNRKVVEPTERYANKRRNSLVITKKTPVMSPKRDPKAEGDTTNLKKTTRSTRAKTDKTIETPKTRTRAQKATVVVTKPSPQLKPRRGKRTEPPAVPETKRLQRDIPKQSQKGRKTKDPESKAEERPAPKRTRKTTAQTESSTAAPEEAPKRSRRGKADLTNSKTVDKTTRRSKKVVIETEVETLMKPKRGRPKTIDNIDEVYPAVKRTRGRGGEKEQEQEQEQRQATTPRTRATRARVAVVLGSSTNTQTKGGKRKATVPEEIPTKVSKSEASKRKATLSNGNKDDSNVNETGRGRRQKVELTESPAKVSRSRATRGKMAATTTTKTTIAEVGKRRGVTSVQESSKKGSRVVSVSPARRTRGARAALAAPAAGSGEGGEGGAGGAATRSRRR